jgi:hypothetical protein
MQKSRALRGHPAPAHPRKHARTDAPRNLAAIHRGFDQKIRAGIPGIALRTTFIVGFPGETEASFNTLLDFIRETKFERLGVFAYSKEDGTRAGRDGRPAFRQGETKAPRTGDGRAAQGRPAVSESLSAAKSKCSSKARRMRNSFSRPTSVRGNTASSAKAETQNSKIPKLQNYLVAAARGGCAGH